MQPFTGPSIWRFRICVCEGHTRTHCPCSACALTDPVLLLPASPLLSPPPPTLPPSPRVDALPRSQLNQDFLRTCVSFDDGGDYDVSETQTCRESLQNVEGTFDTKVQERSKQLEALEELFNTTVELFGDAFTKNVEACVEVR